MKTYHLFFLLFSMSLVSVVNAQFEVVVKGNPNSTHYIKPFVAEITNTSKSASVFSMDIGTKLIADDASLQNFIVTDPILVKLNPGESSAVEIFAMCIESDDAAPGEEDVYKIGEQLGGNLQRFAQFISDNDLHETDPQFLMWDIADGYYKDEQIDGFKVDENDQVWAYMVREGEEEKIEVFDTDYEPEPFVPTVMYQGNFEMNFAFPMNVHIAIFNQQNIVQKEIYKNPETPKGSTRINYDFTSEDLETGKYFIRLIANGDIMLERNIEI